MEIKIGKAYHKLGPMSLGGPRESPLMSRPGFEVWRRWLRYGDGAAPNLSSFSPTDVCTKEHLGNKKTGCGRENQLRNNLRKTHTYEEFMVAIWKTSGNMDSWCWLLNVFCWHIYLAILWAKAKLPNLRCLSVHPERVALSQKESDH